MNTPNYYCLNCPHSGAMHSGPRMQCGGVDAAGDTCDCEPFVADLSRPPMKEFAPKKAPYKMRAKDPAVRGILLYMISRNVQRPEIEAIEKILIDGVDGRNL